LRGQCLAPPADVAATAVAGAPRHGGGAAAHGEVLPGAVHPDAAAPPSHVLSLRNGDKDRRGTKVTKLTKLTRKRRNMKKLMAKVKSP